MVERDHRQPYLADEFPDIFLIGSPKVGLSGIGGIEVEVHRVLGVHGPDPVGPGCQGWEVGDDRLVPEEVAVEGRLILHGFHDTLRVGRKLSAHQNVLDAGLVGGLQCRLCLGKGGGVSEAYVETGFLEFPVPGDRSVVRRDAVPCQDRDLILADQIILLCLDLHLDVPGSVQAGDGYDGFADTCPGYLSLGDGGYLRIGRLPLERRQVRGVRHGPGLNGRLFSYDEFNAAFVHLDG